MAKIGFIGLGHMGNPMTHNLIKAGHEVMVFDLSVEAVQKSVDFGAKSADSLASLAQWSDVVITMLQTGAQVQDVCLKEGGLFENVRPGNLYIDCSSIDITSCRLLHDKAQEKGLQMIDAPVSGGVAGAEKATLTFMVGGAETSFEKAKTILACMGKRVIHAGANGNGQAAKICNNMVLGISMIAISEAFVLGKKLGLDPQKFFEISSNASGQCWSLTNYCPMPGVMENVPSSHEFKPGFTAKMMLKDLRLSQDAAQQVNASTPLGAEATALYNLFVNDGFADLDFSGIIKMLAGEEGLN